jgi:hypothetical protein
MLGGKDSQPEALLDDRVIAEAQFEEKGRQCGKQLLRKF